MKKKTLGIALLMALSSSSLVKAQSPVDANMMLDMMKQDPGHYSFGECLGFSKLEFDSTAKEILEFCMDKHDFNDEVAFGGCMQTQLSKSSGKSQKEIDDCDNNSEQAATSAPADGMKELDNLIDMSAQYHQSNASSLKKITLPIYQDSQVIMHMQQGLEMPGSGTTLPGATFASKDSLEKVVEFYRKKLPNFVYKKHSNGEHLFMEKMPKDFDMIADYALYTNTPHVHISTIRDKSSASALKGAKTKIMIGYKP